MITYRLIYCSAKCSFSFFFLASIPQCTIFPLCTCTIFLCPFMCQWTFWLLACLGYCISCCGGRLCACVYLTLVFSVSWPHSRSARLNVAQFVPFNGTSILFSLVAVTSLHPSNSMEGTHFSKTTLVFIVCILFADGHSDGCEVYFF